MHTARNSNSSPPACAIAHIPAATHQLRVRRLWAGQTLISALIGIAIFLILANAVFTLIRGSFTITSYNRARISARHLAQEKIEFIRNLPYNSIGTSGGIPSGSILQTEMLERNGLAFTVSTDITYIDDAFDQTAPSDTLPTDYKRVRVAVSWGGVASSKNSPVVFVTDIAPKGVETTAGGGTLSIFVIDANGQPVPQANVTITASTSPAVNLTLDTGDNGRIILPGALTCNSCYRVSATKGGYSTERTYAKSEVSNPTKPDLTVLAGKLVEVTLSIDRTADLTIHSTDTRTSGFAPKGNVSFQMRGAKTIGTTSNGTIVYKYDQTLATDGSGDKIINNLEWDNYSIFMNSATTLDISGINPKNPLTVQPSTTNTVSFATDTHTTNNLLTTFLNAQGQQVASVSGTLIKGASTLTGVTGSSSDPDFGQIFFKNTPSGTNVLTATASGYLNYSGNVSVSGVTQSTVTLTGQ